MSFHEFRAQDVEPVIHHHLALSEIVPMRKKSVRFRDRLFLAIGPTLVIAMGATVVASAQSSSPFAKRGKTQAWETPQSSQPAPDTQTMAPGQARRLVPSQPPVQAAPVPAQSVTTPSPSVPTPNYTYQSSQPATQALPSSQSASPNWSAYESVPQSQTTAPYGTQSYGYNQPFPPTGAPSAQSYPAPPPKRSWSDRLGLGSLSTLIRGGLRAGVAARDLNGWEEAFVADGDIEAEVSAITQGGLEYGIHGLVRAQYDEGRKGFTRRLADCPPTLAGCPSTLIAGVPTALRGHTSQFYTSGPDIGDDTQVALESAHIFLRSAYGDVTIGRDDGAAYLFSLGAPSLLNVGASNSPVDYTGLDVVKTVNDASGFSEKITYTSPRLLGDQIGVGVQIGASYALDAESCGVDYCVDIDDIAGVLAPDIENVFEAGLALDRTFDNGLAIEGTVTYARGSEASNLAAFDDLQTFGAGIEVSLSDWTLGGSWLNSNQGLQSGDYEAYDIGLTWKPSKLGFTLGYGHATDDLVGLTSDQLTGGVTYDWNDRVRFGAGVQYVDRESLRNIGGTAQLGKDEGTAVFIEGGITF